MKAAAAPGASVDGEAGARRRGDVNRPALRRWRVLPAGVTGVDPDATAAEMSSRNCGRSSNEIRMLWVRGS